jgi:surfeit locus 1 family protein
MPGRDGLPPSNPKRFQGLARPTITAALAVIALLGLGFWQLQRLQWKLGLIAAIAQRVHADAVPIEAVLARGPAALAAAEYTHVSLAGRFHHELERYVYAPGDGDWGWDVFTPLELAGGTRVIVNRGYVPRQLQDRALRAAGMPDSPVVVTGLLRADPGGRPWWSPVGDVAKGNWYWIELRAIAGSMGQAGASQPRPDVYVDADPIAAAAPPAGGATNLDLPNRHLEYALTWFGLAAVLAVVYCLFAVRRLQANRV